MKDSFLKLLIGGTGIGTTEIVEQAVSINPDTVNSAVGLIGQLVILVATLISLFKPKKN
jgi:hypothetical protein